MALDAILFDLDGTLIDRRSSLRVFARHFLETFSSHLFSVSLEAVADAVVTEDADGYRAREEVLAGLLA
ncbi:MAG: HAD family hydrolase, partial [Chloroflexi bacterium]|nr:HAD family hydrolase [Chloroflexota bacterium]